MNTGLEEKKYLFLAATYKCDLNTGTVDSAVMLVTRIINTVNGHSGVSAIAKSVSIIINKAQQELNLLVH